LCYGIDPEKVSTTVDIAMKNLEQVGLSTHEVCRASTSAEILGWEIDGVRGFISATKRRRWRISLAIAFFMRAECDSM